MAEFEGVATVPVHKRNPFTLSGSVPSSDQPRDVPVRVVTQTGQCLGMTHFQYVEEMHDMARQLVHDPAKQALWFAILLEEYGFFGFDSDLAQVLDPLDMQCQGLSEEKSSDDSSENNSDTDYFADVETSSIDSLGYQTLSRSTSEDNISKLYSKEQMKASTHQSISSIGKGAFARNGIMLKTGQIREGVQRKSYVLILRDSHFDSSLPEVVKGLDYTLAFHLAMGSTSIPRQLHTANESFLALRGSRKAQPIIFFCEWHLSLDVLLEGSLVKNNNDHISRAVATKQHCCNQLNEGILAELRTQIPVEKAIPVDWKSSDISVKQSGVHTHRDLWVFTSAFRPTRKTLFVYFADRRDDLPPSNFFEDEDCESQIRCWKWKRSGNNSFKFTETLKAGKLLPGGGKSQMESHTDLPVTYIVRDKQAQTQSESGTCLSWMHAMMHHCWTTESTEKASNITIFDRFLGMRLIHGRLRNSRTPSIISLSVADDGDTEFLSPSGFYEQEFLKGSSSGLRSDDDSKKPKLSIYHQVATSSVENSKKIFKKCTMGAPILHDLTDGQIKGSEAKESKVQSDSSKPQTTADAGVSLPTFVKPAREVNLTKSQFHMAKTSKENFAKCTRVASFSGDLTDSTIIQVNMGEVTKVQADSSNTQTTIDAGESLETLTIDNSEDRESLASAFRPLGTDLMMSSGSRNDDSNKEKVNICQPVVSSGVGNTKINHEKWGMVESVFIDQTNCKIKGNEAKETNVEADSSKTERRTDAGKSLPAYTVDDCEAALRFIYTRPLGTDLMMSSGSRNDDSNKEKVNICQPVVSSGVGNTKINHEKWGMVESVFIDQTNCKIKGNEAKETNVEADSSKTERRTDAGKSLPAYTVDDCEAALRFIYTRHLGMQIGLLYKQLEGLLRTSDSDSATYKLHETEGKAHVSKAKTSKENFAKCTRDASFSGDLTDSTVKVNIGEETKVQADSSNTQRTVDARKSLPAFAIGNCKDKGPPASALRPLRTDLLMSSGSTHGDSNKGKLNICKPVVASCVGNTKVNCEKYGMVKSIFSDDDTDCKIKGNEAKETKIQADSSKTETTIDAGKSLYPLAIERSEIASDTITSLKSRIERVRLACKMSCLDRVFGVLDQSDSSSSDISGIIEGNPYGNMTICTFDDLPVWSFGEKFRFIVIDHRSDSSSRRDISRIIEGNPYGNMTQGTSGIIEGNPYGNMTIGTFDDLPVGSFAETVMVIVIDRSDSSSRRDISRIIEGNPYENMMEGTFDDLLVWPFAGTVTVSVIDRSGSRASSNISRIIQAKPNVFCLPTAP
ncbi:uncharacterized protein [Montipora foliosa]|uniref:uncharacterized protein isoform X1 n=1 Tax=Montipora foliosa TaxID=591990 RepID=UPI0035F1DF8B